MKSVFSFIFSIGALVGAGSLSASEWMQLPLGARSVELDGAVYRNGAVYVAEPELASTAFKKNPQAITSSGRDIARLFDGNPNSFWSASGAVGEITVDLGTETAVTALEWDGFIYGETFPVSFEIWVMKSGGAFSKVNNIQMTGPSGEKAFSSGTVSGNLDSHGVRLELGRKVSARHVMLKILGTSDGNSARLSRLAILGDGASSKATVSGTFAPHQISAWGGWRIEGQGIASRELRVKATGAADWGSWVPLSESSLRSLSADRADQLQIKVSLDNGRAGGRAVLRSMAVQVDGAVAGPPLALVPENGARIAATRPRLLWEGGSQSDYLTKAVYEVEVSRGENFDPSATFSLRVSDDDTVELPELPKADGEAKIFWRVRRVSSRGSESWSTPFHFTLGQVPAPRVNGSSFGMNMGLDWRPWGEQLAADAGFSWARLNLPWYRLQNSAGEWDWSETDKMMQVARRRDISVLGILGYTARQFSSNTSEQGWHLAPPASLKPWISYVSEVATRYRDDVAAWEIWNEQNHRGFFSGTPEEYAILLKTAYIAIKNISPDSLVTFGGHAGFSPNYLDAVNAKIGPNYWDILNWHCYPGMPNERYYHDWLAKVFGYLHERGLDKPVWLTEIGFSRRPNSDPDDYRLSCYLVAHLAANKQVLPGRSPNKIEKIFPFQLVEGHGYGTVQQWAMVVDYPTPSEPPKRLPVFNAFAHAVRLLDQVKWLGSEDQGNIFIHRFQFAEKGRWTDLNVVWSGPNAPDTQSVRLVGGSDIEIRDVFGEAVPSSSDRQLQIGSGVYFILSAGPCQVRP